MNKFIECMYYNLEMMKFIQEASDSDDDDEDEDEYLDEEEDVKTKQKKSKKKSGTLVTMKQIKTWTKHLEVLNTEFCIVVRVLHVLGADRVREMEEGEVGKLGKIGREGKRGYFCAHTT